MLVPIAPSKTTMRSFNVSRKLVIVSFSKKPKPRASQRGAFHQISKLIYGKDSPSCLADYFTWPQVALTHHVCHRRILNHCGSSVSRPGLTADAKSKQRNLAKIEKAMSVIVALSVARRFRNEREDVRWHVPFRRKSFALPQPVA